MTIEFFTDLSSRHNCAKSNNANKLREVHHLLWKWRSVEWYHYTVAMLSHQYLESKFAELENIVGEYLGLENSERRMITVMVEASKPRLRMCTRQQLNILNDTEFDAGIATLINALRERPIK